MLAMVDNLSFSHHFLKNHDVCITGVNVSFFNKYTLGRRHPKIGQFQLAKRAILRASGVNNICVKISGLKKITNKRDVF